mmetsp:Transcript_124316/g.247843  ORF Transcript_124316/g.247843 Transcript_124316/m.247843 type:complete len:366 (+) Transcript_124316:71-1168(+)
MASCNVEHDVLDEAFDDCQRLLPKAGVGRINAEVDWPTSLPLEQTRRAWRPARRLAQAVALVLVVTVAVAAPFLVQQIRTAAQTQSLRHVDVLVAGNKGLHLVNGKTGFCLDWNAVIVHVVRCTHSSKTQLWKHSAAAHQILSAAGRCLDGGGKFVHVWKCTSPSSSSQRWSYDSKKKRLSFTSAKAAVVCLTANRTSLTLQPCHSDAGYDEQRWEFKQELALAMPVTSSTQQPVKHSPGPQSGTREEVQVRHFPKICLVSGTDVHMDECNDHDRRQRWTHDVGSGQLRDSEGRCLDARSPDLLRECGEFDPNQAWGINEETGHILTEWGVCLDAWWPSKSGKAVTLRACQEANTNQQWSLKRLV